MIYAVHLSDSTKSFRVESIAEARATIKARHGYILRETSQCMCEDDPRSNEIVTWDDFPQHNAHKHPLEIAPLNLDLFRDRISGR